LNKDYFAGLDNPDLPVHSHEVKIIPGFNDFAVRENIFVNQSRWGFAQKSLSKPSQR
jgi:hypothetical protein